MLKVSGDFKLSFHQVSLLAYALADKPADWGVKFFVDDDIVTVHLVYPNGEEGKRIFSVPRKV